MSTRQTEVLRVRKQILAVDLALQGVPARRVEVFLAEGDPGAPRRRRLIDLLERGTSFVPARDSETARWEIVHRELIVWVRVPLADLDVDGPSDELFDISQKVRVDLTFGSPLHGELLYSAEETLTRVTDYMNHSERFFRLWTEADLYLVHKAFVSRVIEEN